jgi:hypothetical protein
MKVLRATFVGVLFVATGCGEDSPSEKTAPSEPSAISVTGEVHAAMDVGALVAQEVKKPSREQFIPGETPCQAKAEVAPGVAEGAQVVIKDADGSTIGTSQLGKGVLDPAGDKAPAESPCVFAFEASVPGGGDFYEFEFGGTAVTVPIGDLESTVILEVG